MKNCHHWWQKLVGPMTSLFSGSIWDDGGGWLLKGGNAEKISWQGLVVSVQPRIRLTRSFDERSHTYLGYYLLIREKSVVTMLNFRLGLGKKRRSNLDSEWVML